MVISDPRQSINWLADEQESPLTNAPLIFAPLSGNFGHSLFIGALL